MTNYAIHIEIESDCDLGQVAAALGLALRTAEAASVEPRIKRIDVEVDE